MPLWANGPFKLDRWEHDVVVEVSPNPGHWNFENLHVKKVYEPIIPAETAVLAYERGEGDQTAGLGQRPCLRPAAVPGGSRALGATS